MPATFKSLHRRWLAYYPETTQGTGPADWNADGVLIDHTESNPDSITQELVENENLETRIFAQRLKIKGLRNTDDFKVMMYIHGAEEEAAADAEVTKTALMTILEHTLGGIYVTEAKDVTGGTSTVPTLSNTTTIIRGSFLAFRDADDTEGRVYIRRVVDLPGGTDVELDEELPFTPTVGDFAQSCAALYIDPEVLENSCGAAERTFSWRVEGSGDDTVFELNGTKAALAIQDLERGAPPKLELSVFAANFQTVDEGISKTTWTQTPAGQAPLIVGRDTELFLQVYGTKTNPEIHAASLSIAVGVPVQPIDTITEEQDNMEGRAAYTTRPEDTTANVTLAPHENLHYDRLQNETFTVARYEQKAAAGKAWAVHMSRAEYSETPTYAETSEVEATAFQLRAHEDLDNASATNTDLWKSKITLVLA